MYTQWISQGTTTYGSSQYFKALTLEDSDEDEEVFFKHFDGAKLPEDLEVADF